MTFPECPLHGYYTGDTCPGCPQGAPERDLRRFEPRPVSIPAKSANVDLPSFLHKKTRRVLQAQFRTPDKMVRGILNGELTEAIGALSVGETRGAKDYPQLVDWLVSEGYQQVAGYQYRYVGWSAA